MKRTLVATLMLALGIVTMTRATALPASGRGLPQTKAEKTVAEYVAHVEKELKRRISFARNEQNDAALWRQVHDTVESFLMAEWRNGTLQGRNASEAFFVRCDRTTMTQNDIDHGVLVCAVGVARVRPAEFSIIRLKQAVPGRIRRPEGGHPR